MTPTPGRIQSGFVLVLAALLLAGCISPYSFSDKIAPRYRLTTADAVRLAAQAMQSVGYFATRQDDRQGFIVGERQDRDSFGADMFTLYLEVRFAHARAADLEMTATCSISKNMAYTDQLDDECEKFRAAFAQMLERRSAVAQPATKPRLPAPEPAPQPTAPTRKEFSL